MSNGRGVAAVAVSALVLALALLAAAWQIDEHFVPRREFTKVEARLAEHDRDLDIIREDLAAIRQELGIPRAQRRR